MAGNKLYIQGYYKLHTINIPSVHARDFQLDLRLGSQGASSTN